MELKGLGGKQQIYNRERITFKATHFNIALEMLEEDEGGFIEMAREFFRKRGITFKEVGGGPTHFLGKRCPKCNAIIHVHTLECGHCGLTNIK